jgi:formate dehydrogenase subunit gamma
METRTAWADAVDSVLAEHHGRPGALLPILHDIQNAIGYVPPGAVPVIAQALNLSRAEVHGVVTFYHHFRETPPGRHTIRICRAESCQAVGAEGLIAHAQRHLGIGFHETTADGAITLEPVYCLGNCALSPALLDGESIHGRVTPDRFDALVREIRGQA